MAELIQQRGGRILTGAGVSAIRRQGSGLVLETARGPVEARHLVNCGGLHSDRVAGLTGRRRPRCASSRSAASTT